MEPGPGPRHGGSTPVDRRQLLAFGVPLVLTLLHLASRSRLGPALHLAPFLSWPGYLCVVSLLVSWASSGVHPQSEVAHPTRGREDPPLLAALLAALLLAFCIGFCTFEATIYPTGHDQLDFFLLLYRTGEDLGRLSPLGVLTQLASMKGVLLQWVAFASLLVFGASRLSLALANFAFLVGFVTALFAIVRMRADRYAAWGAVGLFLLASSMHRPLGGLRDLRWDCAGLMTYGLFTLTLADLLAAPSRTRLAACIAAAGLSVFTRSLTGVYLILATSGCLALLMGQGLLRSWTDARRTRCWACTGALAGIGLWCLAFLATQGAAFVAYYGRHGSTEGRIRSAEFGVGSRLDLLLYFVRSAREHLGPLLEVGLALAALAAFTRWTTRRRPRSPREDDDTSTWLLVSGCAVAGAFLPLSFASASPVVMGVITGPSVVAAVALLRFATGPTAPLHRARPTVSAVLLVLGATSACGQLVSPSQPTRFEVIRQEGLGFTAANELLVGTLAPSARSVVQWLSLHEAANHPVLLIQLHESGRAELARRLHTTAALDFSAAPAPEKIREYLDDADAVVLPERFDLEHVSPLVNGLRETEPQWRPTLEAAFTRLTEVRVESAPICYWVRTLGLRATRGLEPPTDLASPYSWSGEAPAWLEVVNRGDAPRSAQLQFRLEPPPGVREARLVVEVAGRATPANLGEATGWRASVPFDAPPGDTWVSVRITPAASSDDPRAIRRPSTSRWLLWDLRAR